MWRQVLGRTSLGRTFTGKIASNLHSGEHVTSYKVRLKPSKGIFSRFLGAYVTTYVCYYVWNTIAFLPLSKLDLPTAAEDEEETDPIFIPFPFTEKQVAPLPYAGADEEWQNFIKFNRNTELREKVKQDLSLMVKKAAEGTPATAAWAKDGKEFQLGPTWLIMTFPERPPPEFIRTGIEFNDDGIFIKTQKVDASTVALLDRVLKPYPVASASYAAAKSMVRQTSSNVARYFGFPCGGKELSISSSNPELAKTLKKLEARQTAGGNAAPSSTSASSSESRVAAASSSKPASTVTADTGEKPPGSSTKDMIPFHQSFVDNGSGPWEAFKARYRQVAKPLQYYPPRGSLAVHGLIALDSPKGRLYLDVLAWYHPKTNEFHRRSMLINLRAINPHDQKPGR